MPRGLSESLSLFIAASNVTAWCASLALLTACGERLPLPATTASGLRIEELALGKGEAAENGRYLALAYVGSLADGTVIDQRTRTDPLVVKLGTSRLIAGLAEGLQGMREGGRRRLTLPPSLAYGSLDKALVPTDAMLRYDVELVTVFTRTASGLQYRVLRTASGARPTPEQTVVVRYREWLLSTGRELDSSRKRGDPLEFKLVNHVALPGLEEALAMMTAGSSWQLALPPELAYGPAGQLPLLLPGEDVLLDVELVGMRSR